MAQLPRAGAALRDDTVGQLTSFGVRERQIVRSAQPAIEAAVRADLARNGFGDVAPAHSALLRKIGDDGARPSELAAHAGVTRQAVTKLVDELERLDLVRRDPDPDDGRGVIVRYTDRGRAGVAIARKRMLALERASPRRSAPTAGPRCAQPSRPYSVTILTRTRACLPPQTYPIGNAWTTIKHARPVSERSGTVRQPPTKPRAPTLDRRRS